MVEVIAIFLQEYLMKMKYKKLLFILLLSSVTYGQIAQDKKLHFMAGALVSTATYDYVFTKTKSKKKAFIYSVASSIIAGLGKELLDQYNYGSFDNKDLLATALGGVSATITINIFTKK